MATALRLPRTARRPAAAWVVVPLAAALVLATLLLDLRLSPAALDAAHAEHGTPGVLVGALLVGCGALVRARLDRSDPARRLGLVLAGFGLLWQVDGLLESWAALGAARARPWPGTGFAFWFVDRVGAFLLVGLPLLLVLYPTGRLPGGRWRPVALAVVGAAALLPVVLLLVPLELASAGEGPAPVPVWDPVRLPVPRGLGLAVLTIARLLALTAPLGALAVVLARYRGAAALDRRRLRWLLWAGIVAVLVVALALLFPSSWLTTTALLVAVAVAAVSATTGLVGPDRFDVDTLVAGTLLYATVALVVVGLDLVLVAAGSALLGPRLSERNVTLVALLVAVVVYAPLRAWVAGLLRRVLVGRRGDRYQVVSALAARLEESRDLDDQLPALAGAVAEAFKVGFVEVEVLRANGEALVATYGRRPADTTEQPITYQGEQVGRLTLPGRGLRALLSTRDRRLLLDVVRQAAVAVRTATLARDLQLSREQLVLAREDDRRRIRRDLHDGLGPTLSGVGLRLDAAANAVATEPDRALSLVRQARAEVGAALGDVRRLVHGLRPPALDELGLVAAVEQQAEGLRAGGTRVRVLAGELGVLPAATEVAAYRIAAEALTNVGRHAAASSCEVRLSATGGALELVVVDDGRGVPAGATAGVGLLSLHERAAELGGRAEVADADGGGTRVSAWLPLGAGARG